MTDNGKRPEKPQGGKPSNEQLEGLLENLGNMGNKPGQDKPGGKPPKPQGGKPGEQLQGLGNMGGNKPPPGGGPGGKPGNNNNEPGGKPPKPQGGKPGEQLQGILDNLGNMGGNKPPPGGGPGGKPGNNNNKPGGKLQIPTKSPSPPKRTITIKTYPASKDCKGRPLAARIAVNECVEYGRVSLMYRCNGPNITQINYPESNNCEGVPHEEEVELGKCSKYEMSKTQVGSIEMVGSCNRSETPPPPEILPSGCSMGEARMGGKCRKCQDLLKYARPCMNVAINEEKKVPCVSEEETEKYRKCTNSLQWIKSTGGRECLDSHPGGVYLSEKFLDSRIKTCSNFEGNADEMATIVAFCESDESLDAIVKMETGKCGLALTLAKDFAQWGEDIGRFDSMCAAESKCEDELEQFLKKYGKCERLKVENSLVLPMLKQACRKRGDQLCGNLIVSGLLNEKEGDNNDIFCSKDASAQCLGSVVKTAQKSISKGLRSTDKTERLFSYKILHQVKKLNLRRNTCKAQDAMAKFCDGYNADDIEVMMSVHPHGDDTLRKAARDAASRVCKNPKVRQCYLMKQQLKVMRRKDQLKRSYRECAGKQTSKGCVKDVCVSQLQAGLMEVTNDLEKARSLCLDNGGGKDGKGEKEYCMLMTNELLSEGSATLGRSCAAGMLGIGNNTMATEQWWRCPKCEKGEVQEEGEVDFKGCKVDDWDIPESAAVTEAYSPEKMCQPKSCNHVPNECPDNCDDWARSLTQRLGCCQHHMNRMVNNVVPVPKYGVPEVMAMVSDQLTPYKAVEDIVKPNWKGHLMYPLSACPSVTGENNKFEEEAMTPCGRPFAKRVIRKLAFNLMPWKRIANDTDLKQKMTECIQDRLSTQLGAVVKGVLKPDTDVPLEVVVPKNETKTIRSTTRAMNVGGVESTTGTMFEMVIDAMSDEAVDTAVALFDAAADKDQPIVDEGDLVEDAECDDCMEGVYRAGEAPPVENDPVEDGNGDEDGAEVSKEDGDGEEDSSNGNNSTKATATIVVVVVVSMLVVLGLLGALLFVAKKRSASRDEKGSVISLEDRMRLEENLDVRPMPEDDIEDEADRSL